MIAHAIKLHELYKLMEGSETQGASDTGNFR